MTDRQVATLIVRIAALLLGLPSIVEVVQGIIEVRLQGYIHEVDLAVFVTEPLLVVIALLMFLRANAVAALLGGKDERESQE